MINHKLDIVLYCCIIACFLFSIICIVLCLMTTAEYDSTTTRNDSVESLLVRNILELFTEIIYTKMFVIIFALVGLIYLYYQIRMYQHGIALNFDLAKALASILVPFFTFALQGFTFSKQRKRNSLVYLLAKRDGMSLDEEKFIRET